MAVLRERRHLGVAGRVWVQLLQILPWQNKEPLEMITHRILYLLPQARTADRGVNENQKSTQRH